MGGHPGPEIDTCLVYDYSTNDWYFFEPLPAGRAGGGMVYSSVSDALIFAAGATRPIAGDADAVDFQNTWMYEFQNPEAGWVPMDDLPFPSNHMSSGKWTGDEQDHCFSHMTVPFLVRWWTTHGYSSHNHR